MTVPGVLYFCAGVWHRLLHCRCGYVYPVREDAECSDCPRCGKFAVHALLQGWRRDPFRLG